MFEKKSSGYQGISNLTNKHICILLFVIFLRENQTKVPFMPKQNFFKTYWVPLVQSATLSVVTRLAATNKRKMAKIRRGSKQWLWFYGFLNFHVISILFTILSDIKKRWKLCLEQKYLWNSTWSLFFYRIQYMIHLVWFWRIQLFSDGYHSTGSSLYVSMITSQVRSISSNKYIFDKISVDIA